MFIMSTEQQKYLLQQLIQAFVFIDNLRTWLQANLTSALPYLASGNLSIELVNLMQQSMAEDGMQRLLQQLCDDPPDPGIPPLIEGMTLGAVTAGQGGNGGQQNAPDERWYVAGRPFVNRITLRAHLRELANSAGPASILVIEGSRRTGKTFAISMARGFRAKGRIHRSIDIDYYARHSVDVDARELAVQVAGTDKECPPFDITKEDQAVPGLLLWLKERLGEDGRSIWLIVDHCNRRILTRGARNLLKLLIESIYGGELQDVRVILADFDRNELPPQLQESIRHDQAELPDRKHVEEWCRQMAILGNKLFADTDPAEWADEVFLDLDQYKKSDGTWQMAFEQNLRHAADQVRACKERP
jgi:hypothetical protein